MEKRLEQALALEEEQPYEAPENWLFVKLGAVTEIYTGNSINEKINREKYLRQPEGVPFIATKNIGFNHTVYYDNGVKINDIEKI